MHPFHSPSFDFERRCDFIASIQQSIHRSGCAKLKGIAPGMQFFATTLWTATKKGCKTDLKPSLVYQEIHSYIKGPSPPFFPSYTRTHIDVSAHAHQQRVQVHQPASGARMQVQNTLMPVCGRSLDILIVLLWPQGSGEAVSKGDGSGALSKHEYLEVSFCPYLETCVHHVCL